jgi:DNA-binding NarL/FixJ family response regulator/uncharacterized protein involved in exopolysaccharide biosynthesis
MVRILLVDDQKMVRELLREVLVPEPDFEVVGTASDGYTAIEQVECLKPDVVLLDIEMPDMDGMSATRQICQQFPFVRVIVLSSHDDDEYINEALRVGAVGYLLKSTPSEELTQIIRLIDRGYSHVSPGLLEKVTHSSVSMPSQNLAENISENNTLNGTATLDKTAAQTNQTTEEPSDSVTIQTPKSWRWYLKVGLLANVLVWLTTLLYLKLAPQSFTSKWAVTLPSSTSSTNVQFSELGEMQSFSESPYSSEIGDPRENYKFLAETDELLATAANRLGQTSREFGEAKVSIVDNSTLMEFAIVGDTPEEARTKAISFQDAFDIRVEQLREADTKVQNISLQRTLNTSKEKLQIAQQHLAEFKANSGLSSSQQLQDLSKNIEDLRRQRSEAQAQLQQVNSRFIQLSGDLGISAQEAGSALLLQSDPIFQQYLTTYSSTSSQLTNLKTKFRIAHPAISSLEAERSAAVTALLQRAQSLLGQPIEIASIEKLNLIDSGASQRDILFQELITSRSEQDGLKAQANELDRQILRLESRLAILGEQESKLNELRNEVRVAEVVFSSTLAKLDLSVTKVSNAYPNLSIVMSPNLPEKAS